MRGTLQFKKSLMGACAVAAMTLAAGQAMAGGFANRQQSATGMGFSYAGAGTSAFGIGSMFWNPANITNFEGRRSEWNLSLIVPNSSISSESLTVAPPLPGFLINPQLAPFSRVGSGNINQGSVAPASYNSFQINNWLWLGLQTGSPFGSSTKADPNFAGIVYGRSTKIRATAITPTVGVKVNDWLAFGFGVTGQQLFVSLKGGDPRFLGVAVPPIPPVVAALGGLGSLNEVRGDAYGVGWTAGVTLKPLQNLEIGLGYRSSIRHALEGSFLIAPPAGGLAAPLERLIKANVNTPDMATLGVKYDINAQWTLTGTVQWTNWSRIKIAPLVSRTTGAPITGLGFRYEDEWFFALGAQYNLNQSWSFRAGVAYEKSPITDETRGVRVLDNDRIWLSLGANYRYSSQLEFDISYSHIMLQNGRVDIVGPGNVANPPGNPVFNRAVNFTGSSKGHVDIISASVKYRWDAPAAAPVRPVVTKF